VRSLSTRSSCFSGQESSSPCISSRRAKSSSTRAHTRRFATACLGGVCLDAQLELRRTRRPADAPDAPLGGEHLRRLDRRPYGFGSSSPEHSASLASSTGSWGRLCSSSRSSTASSATRCPTTFVSGTASGISLSRSSESIPAHRQLRGLLPLWRQFPGNSIVRGFYHTPRAGPAGDHGGAHRRPSRDARPPEAHTVPGRGHTPRNVVGSPLWPTFIAKTTGFMFLTVAVTGILSALFQINPVWLYGRTCRTKVSYAVQPDWYMGWLDGALRIMPSWETVGSGT